MISIEMKRWSAALCLAVSSLLYPIGRGIPSVLAQQAPPENRTTEQQDVNVEQVIRKLYDVPVFIVGNKEGGIFIEIKERPENAGPDIPEEVKLVRVFIGREDADRYLTELQAADASSNDDAVVVSWSLGQVYYLAQTQEQEEDTPIFQLMPEPEEVRNARALLTEQNVENAENFNEVPLFLARGGPEGQVMVIQRDNSAVVPMFFSKSDLERQVAGLTEGDPSIADTIEIEVRSLGDLISILETSDRPELNQIVLIPPEASWEFVPLLRQATEQRSEGGER